MKVDVACEDFSQLGGHCIRNARFIGRGRTVVMTSHDLGRVQYLASRFDVLSGGVIAASTTPAGLGGRNLLDFYSQALAG